MWAGRLQYLSLFLLIAVSDALRTDTSGPLSAWPPPKDTTEAKKPVATGKNVNEMVANFEDHSPVATPESNAPSINLKKRVKEIAGDWEAPKSDAKETKQNAPKKLSKVWPPPKEEATEAEDSSPSAGLTKHVKDMASEWEKKKPKSVAEPAPTNPQHHVQGDKSWMNPESLDEDKVIDDFLNGGVAEDLPEIDAGGKHVKDIVKDFAKKPRKQKRGKHVKDFVKDMPRKTGKPRNKLQR